MAGWCLADPRFARGERPVVALVCPSVRAALRCARRADEVLRGRIGRPGEAAARWRYPRREQVLFAVESAIHHDDPTALALPPRPFEGQFEVVELLRQR